MGKALPGVVERTVSSLRNLDKLVKRIRLGVIGCGVMGKRHAAAAKESEFIDLVAVADRAEDRALELSAEYDVPKVYEDGADLLQDDGVDAVVIALPTFIRSSLALKALQRGKHVLLEKPVAMSVEELKGFIEAKGDRVGACCSSRYRFLPSSQRAAEFLRGDRLGPIRTLSIRFFTPAQPKPEKEKPAWRLSRKINGGGILVNWGCYDLDYMLGLTGWALQPVCVLAQTWPIAPILSSHIPAESDAETHLIATVRCANGTVISIERAEYASTQNHPVWEIVGTRGSLRMQMTPGEGKKIYHDYLDANEGCQSEVLWEGSEDAAVIHRRPVQDFAEAIVEGRAPATTLEQSLIIQKITDGIYSSAEQQQAIAID